LSVAEHLPDRKYDASRQQEEQLDCLNQMHLFCHDRSYNLSPFLKLLNDKTPAECFKLLTHVHLNLSNGAKFGKRS